MNWSNDATSLLVCCFTIYINRLFVGCDYYQWLSSMQKWRLLFRAALHIKLSYRMQSYRILPSGTSRLKKAVEVPEKFTWLAYKNTCVTKKDEHNIASRYWQTASTFRLFSSISCRRTCMLYLYLTRVWKCQLFHVSYMDMLQRRAVMTVLYTTRDVTRFTGRSEFVGSQPSTDVCLTTRRWPSSMTTYTPTSQ